jgi:Tol biopolymer transport system component
MFVPSNHAHTSREGTPRKPDADAHLAIGPASGAGQLLICRSSSGAGESISLQELPSADSATDWSPDGRYLLTESANLTSGDSEVSVVPLDPKEKPRVLQSSPYRSAKLDQSPSQEVTACFDLWRLGLDYPS